MFERSVTSEPDRPDDLEKIPAGNCRDLCFAGRLSAAGKLAAIRRPEGSIERSIFQKYYLVKYFTYLKISAIVPFVAVELVRRPLICSGGPKLPYV
jgi:hypothetical protein